MRPGKFRSSSRSPLSTLMATSKLATGGFKMALKPLGTPFTAPSLELLANSPLRDLGRRSTLLQAILKFPESHDRLNACPFRTVSVAKALAFTRFMMGWKLTSALNAGVFGSTRASSRQFLKLPGKETPRFPRTTPRYNSMQAFPMMPVKTTSPVRFAPKP